MAIVPLIPITAENPFADLGMLAATEVKNTFQRAPKPQETVTEHWLIQANGQGAVGTLSQAPPDWIPEPPTSACLFIGYWQQKPVYLQPLEPAQTQALIPWRTWFQHTDAQHFALYSTCAQVWHWWHEHVFCGRCGQQTFIADHEFARICPACAHTSYPRISPCIITLVVDGERFLLAHSPRFKTGFYSTLAGFIEAGESAEQALRREVYEEVGLHLGRLHYLGSQSWPFSHSLMLGYLAEYQAGDIRLDKEEITDAAWFGPDDLPLLPPQFAISRQLIDYYLSCIAAAHPC